MTPLAETKVFVSILLLFLLLRHSAVTGLSRVNDSPLLWVVSGWHGVPQHLSDLPSTFTLEFYRHNFFTDRYPGDLRDLLRAIPIEFKFNKYAYVNMLLPMFSCVRPCFLCGWPYLFVRSRLLGLFSFLILHAAYFVRCHHFLFQRYRFLDHPAEFCTLAFPLPFLG